MPKKLTETSHEKQLSLNNSPSILHGTFSLVNSESTTLCLGFYLLVTKLALGYHF